MKNRFGIKSLSSNRQLFHYIKFYTMLLTLFLMSLSCQNKSDQAKPKMAIIISTLNNPWFVFLAESAKAKAAELGYEGKVFDSQNNTSLESDHFENIIVSGYKAILFNPTDANGSIANIQKAKEAGIPVFCIDREVNSSTVATSQILSDSFSGTVALGKYFVQQLNKKGKYVELLGLPTDNNTWSRSKGFHSVVDDFKDLKMVAQQAADFDRNKGLEVMESILLAHPDIDAVFAVNDAMAMGAYQAIVSAGLQNKVKVFGFDGADDVVDAIKANKISATAMQFPKVMAEMAAVYADQYLKGKRDFAQKIPVAVELVTKQNVDDYVAYGKK